jgi:hypothetical protein
MTTNTSREQGEGTPRRSSVRQELTHAQVDEVQRVLNSLESLHARVSDVELMVLNEEGRITCLLEIFRANQAILRENQEILKRIAARYEIELPNPAHYVMEVG